MDEQQAVEFLSGKGYNCLRNNQPSSSVGVSARKKPQHQYSNMTAKQMMSDPAYQAEVQRKLVAAGVFKNGGKKRSCKKRGGKKRSCKKRGGNRLPLPHIKMY